MYSKISFSPASGEKVPKADEGEVHRGSPPHKLSYGLIATFITPSNRFANSR